MNGVDYFILLNCLGTLTNMGINAEILDLTRKNLMRQSEIMKTILDELKKISEELKNGT